MKIKSDSIVKDAGIVASSKIIYQAISLVNIMLLSRFRTLEEYGTYSQILLVVNLFITVFMLGMPNSLNFFLANANTDKQRNNFLSTYYTVNTVLSILLGIILVLSIPLIELYFKNELISSFAFFIAVYPWTRIIMNSLDNLLIVYKKTLLLASYRIINGVAVVLCVLVSRGINLGFREYLWLYLIVEAIFALSVYCIVWKLSGGISVNVDYGLLKKILAFSIPIGLASACGVLKSEIDKLVIGFFCNTEVVAIYTNAAKELPITIIAASLTAVLLPQTARLIKAGKTVAAVELWKDSTVLSLIINAFFSIGLFVFSKEAIIVLYSEKYIDGAMIFSIYSLTYIIRSSYLGLILNSMGKSKYILYNALVILALNAVFNVVFYYVFGIIGPALSTLFVTVLSMLSLLYHTSKQTKISFKSIYPWKESAIIIGVNVLLGILFYFLKNIIQLDSIIGEIGEVFLWATIWAATDFIIFNKKIREKLHSLNTNRFNESEYVM
jgi:O-antigen/teichoic acid export membrane protein